MGMPMEDTATAILMPTATTERDLLMPSLRPIPPSSTPPMVPMVPIPMLTLDSITATLDTTLDTLMPTTERDLLMPIPSSMDMVPIPMLTLDSTTATLDMDTTLDT